ncbi:MAG: YraN family protein [Actinobacteria bacterium]|nr:MAG: YraN family protein [Actinomycetota bacterium]
MKLSLKGERYACLLLKKKGFRILCRNYTCRVGEIDIVAIKNSLLVFCEVKTRSNAKYGQPYEAVNASKQHKLRLLAEQFIISNKVKFDDLRFDVISILENNKEVIHIENAF